MLVVLCVLICPCSYLIHAHNKVAEAEAETKRHGWQQDLKGSVRGWREAHTRCTGPSRVAKRFAGSIVLRRRTAG
eukprot:11971286-Prorocentrum_lima.AAC.1